jgi:hypothetical protein
MLWELRSRCQQSTAEAPALRYEKDPEETEEVEQYQLFETRSYRYRVFLTNMDV